MEQKCGNCTECVDICPTRAFTGRAFDEHEPREARYDPKKCADYFAEMRARNQIDVCGMCVYVCPWGRKGKTTTL
jgi:epoxyqueuosine reductase QueG